jgi:DNA repair photolyase
MSKITRITAKTILNHVKQPDPWFGLKYNMNLYRGCQHQCIYCDSRSACYRIDDFSKIEVKINALELLEDVLPRKRMIGTIGFGSMNDPYMPVEREFKLTGQALEIIREHRFPVHILTKSDLVLEDLDTLIDISRIYAAVSFTITTADDALAKLLEPGAPLPSARFKAMKEIANAGVLTGVTMMPILPFLEDDPGNIRQIVKKTAASGASYIIPAFGITLREGSRDYFYQKLDLHFPGIKEKYIQYYGTEYQCSVPNWRELNEIFKREIKAHKITSKIEMFEPIKRSKESPQLTLFS